MTTIQVTAENLREWARDVNFAGLRVNGSGISVAGDIAGIGARRRTAAGFTGPRGSDPGTDLVDSGLVNLAASIKGMGDRFAAYTMALAKAVNTAAASFEAHDGKSGEDFKNLDKEPRPGKVW
jgi:hypothetical protein